LELSEPSISGKEQGDTEANSKGIVDGMRREGLGWRESKKWRDCVLMMSVGFRRVNQSIRRVFLFLMFVTFLLKPFVWERFAGFFGTGFRVQEYDLEVFELDVPVRKAEFIDPNRQTETEC